MTVQWHDYCRKVLKPGEDYTAEHLLKVMRKTTTAVLQRKCNEGFRIGKVLNWSRSLSFSGPYNWTDNKHALHLDSRLSVELEEGESTGKEVEDALENTPTEWVSSSEFEQLIKPSKE